MKKLIFNVFAVVIVSLLSSLTAFAADITILSPTEDEIMPTRDFYVVGSIDRGGNSAKTEPLDIKIELIGPDNEVVRTLGSNVGPDGVTPASYFLTDYESGSPINDTKGASTVQYTPPEIMYNSTDRDSIRNTYNKIVVKEDYFAAIIYGGATKDIDLKYEDENENALKDIIEGMYTLRITAINSDGQEVGVTETKLHFANTKERFVSSVDTDAFCEENSLVTPDSLVGMWVPERYIDEKTNNYQYITNARFVKNSDIEYGNAKEAGILLYKLFTDNSETTTKLGSVFNEESQAKVNYYYYDTGEKEVSFNFAGSSLTREGQIVAAEDDSFIKILRSDYFDYENNQSYSDFNMADGVILTENRGPIFYGVYTPVDPTATAGGGVYSIRNKVAKIKVVVTDENGDVIYEAMENASLVREDMPAARYEFGFFIPSDIKANDYSKLTLNVFACDTDGNEILTSESITLKHAPKGDFISGYDDTYWGKTFCDTVNFFGQSPSGDALDPDDYITRGDFAAMVNNLLGFAMTGNSDFADLEDDSVFYHDCVTAQQIGYMTGDENSRINADDLISREQAMIILARISKAEMGSKPVNFTDGDEISFWAEKYVNIMCSNGIVTGFDGYLHPTDSITVAEASALIIKTIKWMYNMEDAAETNDDKFDIPDMEISESEFISAVNRDNLTAFLNDNMATFNSVITYLQVNCKNGAYVGKVGAGLEVRDYSMGNFITLSDNALNIITNISDKFAVFSIKYNPASEDAVHFIFGKDENNKDIGLTFTSLEEVKGKTLTHIDGNWYYFVQN